MLVEIKNPEKLHQLERQTGIPAEVLVNEILGIHLDEDKKGSVSGERVGQGV